MQLEVTQSNFSAELRAHQPQANAVSDGVGLAAAIIVFIDMLSVVGLGHGMTGLLMSFVPVPGAGAVFLAMALAAAVNILLLCLAFWRLRGSRWLAAYRRVFRDTVRRPPDLANRGALISTLAPGAVGLLVGVLVFLAFTGGSWLGQLGGWAGPVYFLSFLIAPAIALIVLVIAKTAVREPTASGIMICIVLVICLVIVTGSGSLAQLFADVDAPAALVARLSSWTALFFGIFLGAALMLGFDSEEDSLQVNLKWADSAAGGGALPTLVHNPTMVAIHRSANLTIDPQTSQILLVTRADGSDARIVSTVTHLGAVKPVDLNKTAFAIWDLKAAGATVVSPQAGTVRPPVSDASNLISFNVQPYARPSTAALPRALALDERSYQYLADHVFLSSALSPQMDAAIARAVDKNSRAVIGSFDMVAARADWKSDASSLTFLEDIGDFKGINPFYRTPAALTKLQTRRAEAVSIRNRIRGEITRLGQVQQQLERMSNDIRDSVSTYFLEEIDLLLGKDPNLTEAQRNNIRCVVRLFNFSANPTLVSSDKLRDAQQEGAAVIDKLELELKEAEADLVASMAEIRSLVQTLMSKQFLTRQELKFLSLWDPDAAAGKAEKLPDPSSKYRMEPRKTGRLPDESGNSGGAPLPPPASSSPPPPPEPDPVRARKRKF